MGHRGRRRVRTAALPRGGQLGARLGQRLLERAHLEQLLLLTPRGRLARLRRAGREIGREIEREISPREIGCISRTSRTSLRQVASTTP